MGKGEIMADFISDEEMEKLESQSPDFISDEEMEKLESQSPDFISDEEMENISEQSDESFLGLTKKGIIKSTIESLPIAGGLVGTFGGLPGIAAGAATGKALENIAERYLLDEEKTIPEIYVEPIGEATSAITGELASPIFGKMISKTGSGLGTALRKTVSSLATIPEQSIKTYMKRPEAVKAIGQLSEETAIQDAADNLRKEAVQSIDIFSRQQNSKISKAIEKKGNEMVDVSPLFKIFNEGKKKIDPIVQRSQIQAIDEQIQLLSRLANDNLEAPAWRVESFRKNLNDLTSYTKEGQILQRKGDYSNEVFKKAAARARLNIGKVVPEISEANRELQKLRKMDKIINKNLITPESTPASVIAVGTGQNQQAIKQMRKLEDLTGFPYVEKAQNISSAQHFNNASLLPTASTGRAMLPMGIGGVQAVDKLLEGNFGQALLGLTFAATGSPLAIKGGMEAGLLAKKASPLGATEMAEQLMSRAIQMGVSPYAIDGMIKNSEQLTNTMKAQLRNKNAKAVK